ncbi:GNAT family N-acetyltransferase [Rhodococcus sp. H29-C3]|uniref:GNAT family N-acetyltransferase n=1 Tax=Rhodococcus sp. H29-C3 TaxID=3046307 RepID=UPI0024BBB34C|nr:GNAT family N-acetyltransferase [Rhodococcus sp. H29-C3]MDJ0358957.1 GNAT family N-acetyltransferase [Rhodococcus sp. H29-C3]
MTNGDQDNDGHEPTIVDAPDHHRYEIHVDGQRAGFAAYIDADNQRIFHHTEIDDQHSGQGLAAKLISAALSRTQADGKRIVPVCSYVAAYVEKHHDFDDTLDPVTSAALEIVGAEND